MFRYCETKKLDGESWYPSPSYAWKFSIPEFFSNTEGFPQDFFRYCEKKRFDKKSWPTPLMHKIFGYLKLVKTWGVPVSYEIFRHCEMKIFPRRIVILPFSLPSPLLSIKLFDTRIFLKHRRVPLRSFSVLWDKKFPTENRETRSLSYP